MFIIYDYNARHITTNLLEFWPLWFDASLLWKWFLTAGRPQVVSSLIKLKLENIHRVNIIFHQTRNLSQMRFVKKYFWARVKYPRTNAKNYSICEICRIKARFFTKQLEWACVWVDNCTKPDNVFKIDE